MPCRKYIFARGLGKHQEVSFLGSKRVYFLPQRLTNDHWEARNCFPGASQRPK
jgi:hypothetical protein